MLKKLIILMMVVLLSIFIGCEKKSEVEEKKEELTGIRNVKVAPAKRGDISTYIDFSGKLETKQIVNISPAMSSKIVKLFVEEGDKVEEGNILARLDDTHLVQAEMQYRNLKKKYERMKELKKTGSIDEQTFDEVKTGYEVAKSSFEFMLENTEIRAPFNGTVTLIYKKEGENFDAMMDPMLIRMINLNRMKAKIQVSDVDISKVSIGQKALIKVDSSTEEFIGKITYISPEADMMSGTYTVEISLKNRDNVLKHNQFARIILFTKTSQNTIIVLQGAVLESEYVFVLEDGKAVKKYVTLGLENEFEVEIKVGIKQGEQVITYGNVGLSEGEKVEVSH